MRLGSLSALSFGCLRDSPRHGQTGFPWRLRTTYQRQNARRLKMETTTTTKMAMPVGVPKTTPPRGAVCGRKRECRSLLQRRMVRDSLGGSYACSRILTMLIIACAASSICTLLNAVTVFRALCPSSRANSMPASVLQACAFCSTQRCCTGRRDRSKLLTACTAAGGGAIWARARQGLVASVGRCTACAVACAVAALDAPQYVQQIL